MNFSIILASRERVHLLDSLLNSIMSTTSDKNNCEVICVIDTDDRITRRFVDRFKNQSFIRFVVRDRANNLNDDYLNWAWKNYSRGNNIIVVNDDVVFRTINWDQIAMAHLNNYLVGKPDGIAYGWIQDGLKSRAGDLNYCCFPLITRKAAEAVGFVMPPEFPGWGADIAIYRIYAAIGRICDLSSVVLDHISYHTNSGARDHISLSVEKKSRGSLNPISEYDVCPHVDKIFKLMGINSNSGVITGARIVGATIENATIVAGKLVGGTIVGSTISGGKLVGGVIKYGELSGEFSSGFFSNPGGVLFED